MVLHITPDERHALRLLAEKVPASTIATRLGTSEFELGVQLRTLFARMGAASPADALNIALRRGLLAAPEGGGYLDSSNVEFSPPRSTYV
jgi:DNA-binding CsgD family transcriptional regulator